MEHTTARPRHCSVDGLARQRVSKRRPAAFLLEHEAAPHCFVESLLPGKVEHEREVEPEPHDGRDFERLTSAWGEPLGPEEHGVTHGLRKWEVRAPNELDRRPALPQQPARA